MMRAIGLGGTGSTAIGLRCALRAVSWYALTDGSAVRPDGWVGDDGLRSDRHVQSEVRVLGEVRI